MTDEEKKAIESLKNIAIYMGDNYTFSQQGIRNLRENLRIVLPVIEKQSKEIEELKEDRKSYAEEYIHNNPWLYKQLNENYILRVESEQRERGAYIKGTNDADELCNKKWEDKIKARIEELEKLDFGTDLVSQFTANLTTITILQSLLEKE